MRSYIKTSVALLLLSIISIYMAGCSSSYGDGVGDDYHGEYPDLYSIAIHSLLGSTGYYLSENAGDSFIEVIDEDNYGRKIFSYFENTKISTYSLIISQKAEDGYVYFYPDYNFISLSDYQFTEQQIESLKEKNDWNKEIDKEKCVKVEILRAKSKGPIDINTILKLYRSYLDSDADTNRSITYQMSDEYGRAIYTGYGKYSSHRVIVMLFNPDGSYNESTSVMELTNYYSYQDELKAFKERNNWNQPLN